MTTDIALPVGNLPAEPNSFVGRARDLTELALLLGEARALTLCGPGGIGKTRLALRLAGELLPGFPDGAWLAELADTSDPAMVVRRLAATLGIREEPELPVEETLTDALRSRRLLLILDNCEHLVDASAALVQRLLASCPWVRVIATSREPLRVRGETVWRVPPLELPASGELTASGLLAHEAVRLFADRAAAVRPGFEVGPDNAEAVARLCRMLDGMPLALELAAARVRALSVEQICDRLSDRFQLLASGNRTAPLRQQTLRAAVDWSYGLLTPAEQTLLRRLSVFSGWNLEMAEQVCADEAIPASQVLDLLAALIDKSLVTLDAEFSGDARYRLLDTIRDYATGRLAASGEQEQIRRAHRDYMLRLCEDIIRVAFRRGDPPWPARVAMYHRVAVERPNYRAALAECLDAGDAEAGLRICRALRGPWVAYGDLAEGTGWSDCFLRLGGQVQPRIRASALMLRAELAFEQQDYRTATECAEAAVSLCRAESDSGQAGALRVLALVSLRGGRLDEALASAQAAIESARAAADEWEEGLALAAKAAIIARQGDLAGAQRAFEVTLDVLRDNNGWGVAHTLSGFGNLARACGDYAAALRHFRSALALYQEIDARPEIARCLAGIGWVGLSQGDLELAAESLTTSIRLSLATGQRLAIARGLEALAVLAVARREQARAVTLAGASVALREAAGQVTSASAGARIDALLESARRKLGEPQCTALMAAGAAMSTADAVRFATDTAAPPAGPGTGFSIPAQREASAPDGRGGLTLREREIATLIARGMSNRGIAGELTISPATAARHVANIFAKLGFSSRAQVAAWAVEHETNGHG